MNWFCSNCFYRLLISLNILSLVVNLPPPYTLDILLMSWKPLIYMFESWFSWFSWMTLNYESFTISQAFGIYIFRLWSWIAASFCAMKPSFPIWFDKLLLLLFSVSCYLMAWESWSTFWSCIWLTSCSRLRLICLSYGLNGVKDVSISLFLNFSAYSWYSIGLM